MTTSPDNVQASAPGRVNLLGEHTDYNDGFVLPTAIPQQTRVSLRRNGGDAFRVRATTLDATASFTFDTPPSEHFATYVHGCIREFAAATGATIPGLDIEIDSDVPMGVGLSSSAALEVATLRALRMLLATQLDDVRIAQLAQRAEILYAGVRCGIMDQMASSLADTGSMLFLDTRTLDRRLLPLPAQTELLVLDSGISRSLAGTAYNDRRRECEEAARLLGVRSLRDVTDVAALDVLPETLHRRARHVVTENARVLRVLDGIDAAAFGALMNASHASLRDDYAVSVPPLDKLVAALQGDPEVHGARLTGAGFGGACVALCHADRARAVAVRALGTYSHTGHAGRRLVPP
jgi:galactokinase